MAPLVKKFVIGGNRLARGLMDGFTLSPGGVLSCVKETGRHTFFTRHIDSSERDCTWGRLAFDAEIEDDTVLIVRAFASNELNFMRNGAFVSFDDFLLDQEQPILLKEKLFQATGALKFVGSQDMLLYGQTGRYLWFSIDILGAGSASLKNFRLYSPGDNFLKTFPELYNSNAEFFRRYLSIFSSLYSDFQSKIDSLHQYIDIDTAPDQVLPVFAAWLGIELGGNFLDAQHLRRLLKIAFPLIRVKGTRQAIIEILQVFIDEPFYIVEQHLLQKYSTGEDRHVNEILYGRNPYGFTVLLNRPADEILHSRLLFLLNQFKPLRSQVNIVFLSGCSSLDSYCYLDINARIIQTTEGRLDDQASLSGMTFLQ